MTISYQKFVCFFGKLRYLYYGNLVKIESLVRSITQYTATIGFIFYVISLFVHDFGRILAGAGVAGIVIGFGASAQTPRLVRQILPASRISGRPLGIRKSGNRCGFYGMPLAVAGTTLLVPNTIRPSPTN